MKTDGIRYFIKKQETGKYVALVFDKNIKKSTVGCYEGEVISKAFRYARRKKLPIVAHVSSAGMRITEGTIALMQMAKIVEAVKSHGDKRLLFVCIVDNPTLGGINASLVALADIIIGIKGATFGFAGKRIIQSTLYEEYPSDFQTVEYAQKHGMIDIVAEENELSLIIENILRMHRKNHYVHI